MNGEREQSGNYKDEIYSNAVRAGKRTYFFDVKSTRGGDLYLTITESKKKFNEDGSSYFEKHKIFLYKEDFDKFQNGLTEVIAEIERLKGDDDSQSEESTDDISFEDL